MDAEELDIYETWEICLQNQTKLNSKVSV